MASRLQQLLLNPGFQLVYLLLSVGFLGAVYFSQEYSIPTFLMQALLALHVILLAMRLLKPAFLRRFIAGGLFGGDSDPYLTNETVSPFYRQGPTRQNNGWRMQQSNLFEMEQIFFNGSKAGSSSKLRLNHTSDRRLARKEGYKSVEVSDFTTNERFYDFLDERKRFDSSKRDSEQDRRASWNRDTPEYQTKDYSNTFRERAPYECLEDTSPQSVYKQANIPQEKKGALLSLMKNYIVRLHSMRKDYQRLVDDKLLKIFGQRLEGAQAANVLTMEEVERIVKGFEARGSISRQVFKNPKDDITPELFRKEMGELAALILHKPPPLNFGEQQSIFNFMLWHARRIYYPEPIRVESYSKNLQQPSKSRIVLYEDQAKKVYYFFPQQTNCRYNIEETFLFLFLKNPPSTRFDIIESIENVLYSRRSSR